MGVFVRLLELDQFIPVCETNRIRVTDKEEEVMVTKKQGKKVAKQSVRKSVKKGDVYKCDVCGLAVTVDEVCGCVDTCDIICCEKPMKPRKRA